MKPLYIRLLLLLILFFHISTIGAKDRKLESIYILPIRSSGIHKSLEAELQSILRIETIQLVSERFTILDEDLQRLSGERLAKKQSLGIDEEKDIHPLLKHIEPDYFLFSKLSMSNKSILFLNLRLIKNSGSSYVLQNELVLHFPENLKEFYMAQAIKKLFQKDYQTSEYSIIPIPEALALSFIPSEELWSLEVPNENTKISQILRILKEQEEKAYAAFQAKDYSLSLKHYSVLLNSIQEKLRTEEKNKILDYTNHLKQNFQIVYTYYLRARLDELDKNLQKGKSDKEDTLQSRLTSYSKLLEEYRMYSFYLNSLEIEKKLKDRVVYYKLLLYQKKEKLADTLYYHKNFLESLKAYLDIEQEIRQDKDLPPSYQNSIQKKITNVKKTATFFLKNGVRTYCDNAENINLKLQIQGSIGAEDKSRLEAELEESLVLAERRMKENQEFLTEDIREYYNSTIELVNRDRQKRVGNVYLSSEEEEQKRMRFYKRMDYFLPGIGQGLYGKRQGFWTTALFVGSLYGLSIMERQYYSYRRDYKRTNSLYAYLAYQDIANSTVYSTYSKEALTGIRNKAETLSVYHAYLLLFAIGVYSYNLVDLNHTFPENIKKQTFSLERDVHTFANTGFTESYTIRYSYHF